MPPRSFVIRPSLVILPLVLPLLTACSGPAISSSAHNTFLDSDDLIAMTDKMAASFASDPQIAAQQTPLTIVIKPISNQTNQIIPGHEKQLYVARLQALLNNKPSLKGRFIFVINRDDYDTLINAEGKRPDELGPDPARIIPDYALTGQFHSQTNAGASQRSDYYYCKYLLVRITGPQSGLEIWSDDYETKKSAKNEFLD
jgi:PBP1b-binding outer membrane lipoprotein LpoB